MGKAATGAEQVGRRSRPRILHLATVSMSHELLLGPQYSALLESGFDVSVAAAEDEYTDRLKARGVRFHPLRHATRRMAPIEDVRFFAEVFSLVRRERPDLVHTHTPKPGWFGRPAARIAGSNAVVNTVHGLYAGPADGLTRKLVVYAFERAAAATSHLELVQNPEDVELLRKLRVPSERLVELGNGIDLDRFDRGTVDDHKSRLLRAEFAGVPSAEQADEILLVGVVGRLVWEKGLREVLEAARMMERSDPNVRFVFVGPAETAKADGLTEAELVNLSADLPVKFVGPRNDMAEVYSALDVFVLASHREGFPRSAMEASAMALPVVATDIRGCRQVVVDGQTGLLFRVGDVEGLSRALRKLRRDRGLRERLGQAGAALAVEEFDQRRVIERTIAAYRRLGVSPGDIESPSR